MLTLNLRGYRAQICRNTFKISRFRTETMPIRQRLIWAGPLFILLQHPTTPKD